jgi:hypothetical protein
MMSAQGKIPTSNASLVTDRFNDLPLDGSEEGDSDQELEISRHSERPQINQQDDVNSENSEEWSDDGSIHHDASASHSDSTITTQTDNLASVNCSIQSLTSNQYNLEVDSVNQLPQYLKDHLDAWFRKSGAIMPPFVTNGPLAPLHRSQSGIPAIWTHVSGEKLKPRRYSFHDPRFSGKPIRLVVVESKTQGPNIVKFSNSGRDNYSRYKIWLGVDDNDADGFELIPSIRKTFDQISSTPLKASATCQKDKTSTTETLDYFAVPNSSSPTTLDAESMDHLPQQLKDLLERWYEKHGRILPPCVRHYTAPINLSQKGAPASWWHVSGEPLKAKIFRFHDDHIESANSHGIIVAEGSTKGPYLVRWSGKSGGGSNYKIWLGIGGGDSKGFELEPSVQKSFTDASKPMKDLPSSAKLGHPSSLDKKLNSSVGNFRGNQYCAPPTLSESKGGAYSSGSQTKRKREHEGMNADLFLRSFPSTKQPKRAPSSDKQANKVEAQALPDFSSYVKDNTVLLFYPKHGGPPRVRLFGSCDSIHKLFAQALAGDVFSEPPPATKVLSLRFGGGMSMTQPLVEDDSQDFEDLAKSINAASCWTTDGEKIQGSCTLEVRSK